MVSGEQDSSSSQHGGLFNSLKTLAATLVAMGHTRLELLSTEMEEEYVRLISMLLWMLVALFFAALCIMLATLMVVVVFWDTHRLLAAGVMALLFLLGAAMAGRIVLDKVKAKPRLFASSLAELSKDRERLTTSQ